MKDYGIFLIILLVFTLAPAGDADTGNAFSPDKENIFIAGDYACFRYSDNADVMYTEVYYSFFRNQLYFVPDSTGYHALVDVSVVIKKESGELIDTSGWRASNRVANLSDTKIPNYLMNDIISARLQPGNYNVIITIADANSNLWGRKTIDVAVPAFSLEEVHLSDLELIYNVLDPDGGAFDKAGKKLIPNTRSVFSHDDNVVYFYAEVYNLDTAWTTYTMNIRLYDANGNIYKDIPAVTKPVTAGSLVLLNGFNIASFRVGMYKLEVSVHSAGNSASAEKYFEVTPGKLAWEMAKEREELSDFPEAEKITNDSEAKNFKNQILFIATREELSQYDDLPIEGKNNFARVFWQRRDPSPGTMSNEYKIEHYTRIRYANDNFSTFKAPGAARNGWRTDRGRVYIVYGSPSDIENYPSALDTRPWMKWNYDEIEGGVYFVFIDETGYGDYKLVHSSAQGEPKDYNWEERLTPSTLIRTYDDSYTE
jgi:GWxTD domain-containing protein